MTNHALRREDGVLFLGDSLLLVRYPAGDYDTIDAAAPDMKNLVGALYDEYQMTNMLLDGDTISLDGTVLARCEGVHVVMVVG